MDTVPGHPNNGGTLRPERPAAAAAGQRSHPHHTQVRLPSDLSFFLFYFSPCYYFFFAPGDKATLPPYFGPHTTRASPHSLQATVITLAPRLCTILFASCCIARCTRVGCAVAWQYLFVWSHTFILQPRLEEDWQCGAGQDCGLSVRQHLAADN